MRFPGRGARQGQTQRRRQRRPAPLQNFDRKTAVLCCLQPQAQYGRGGFLRGARRPQQKTDGVAGGRSELEAPHRLAVGICAPAQHGSGCIAAQGLLGGPQGIQLRLPGLAATRLLAHKQEAFERNTGRRPCAGMQGMRRRDQDQPAVVGAQLPEGGQQERQFSVAGAVAEQLGQCATRPAAARQLAIQRRKSARHRRQRGVGETVAAPHVGAGEHAGERDGVHAEGGQGNRGLKSMTAVSANSA